ncbi:hypothetical protein ABZ626_13225 [Streptomyces longispororuber]|uniref:hypothetical protein n=1 Tax=Streptomyces longispororuber TaxID=68230 RepID=UPI0033E5FE6A
MGTKRTKSAVETVASDEAAATGEAVATDEARDSTEAVSEDDAAAEATAEAEAEAEAEAAAAAEADAEAEAAAEAEADAEAEAEAGAAAVAKPDGVGQGAAAVVAAALGLVGLSGGWTGTVASARESLIGQLRTSRSASVARQVQEVYGDSWRTTALVAGAFAVAALVTAVAVLLRPAFGDPARVQAPWIRSVAWAGAALGVIGLALAAATYTDLILGLPSTS